MDAFYKLQKRCLIYLIAGLIASGIFVFSANESMAQSPDSSDPEIVPPDVTLPFPTAPTTPVTPAAPPLATPQTASPGNIQSSATQDSTTAIPAGPATSEQALNKKDPLAIIETARGTITIRLFRKFAPNTTANFIELATKGFYNGLTFHRVEPGFVIQGGDPYGNGSGLYIDPATNQPRFINLEVSPTLKHNAPGVVAMARFGKNPNSASCQFYITLAPQPNLDMQYSIFGGVINGMYVCNQIQKGDKIVSIKIEEQQN